MLYFPIAKASPRNVSGANLFFCNVRLYHCQEPLELLFVAIEYQFQLRIRGVRAAGSGHKNNTD